MPVETLYQPDHVGDWGTPRTVEGGSYGTDTLTRPDGTTIFYRFWRQPDPKAPVLVLVHGLGAHSGWFIDMGSALNERGLAVYALDHRGFGRSSGQRGHVRHGSVFIDDLDAFLDEVQQRQPGAPLFIFGHSMGALFSVNVAARDASSGRNRLAGMILLNPWVVDTTKTSPAAVASILFTGPFGSTNVPPIRNGRDTSKMTTNPEADRMLGEDTYWVTERTASFYYQVAIKMKGLTGGQILRRAREVRAPALVLQAGADLSVVPAASHRLYLSLGSVDKQWKLLPGMEHDTELAPDRAELDDEVAGWIARHMV
jgi:alpha-beta hydrolase superfamily lysophospholipase